MANRFVKFAFKFNLRRYTEVDPAAAAAAAVAAAARRLRGGGTALDGYLGLDRPLLRGVSSEGGWAPPHVTIHRHVSV
jgi:hypothetical protein